MWIHPPAKTSRRPSVGSRLSCLRGPAATCGRVGVWACGRVGVWAWRECVGVRGRCVRGGALAASKTPHVCVEFAVTAQVCQEAGAGHFRLIQVLEGVAHSRVEC